jgi:hypothetical protein
MDYLLSSPDHSLDPWMLLSYGLENQLNALPNQENFENQCPHVASIEVSSDGTREFSNSICCVVKIVKVYVLVTLLVYFVPPSLTLHRNMKTLWVIIVYYVPMTSALYST